MEIHHFESEPAIDDVGGSTASFLNVKRWVQSGHIVIAWKYDSICVNIVFHVGFHDWYCMSQVHHNVSLIHSHPHPTHPQPQPHPTHPHTLY